MTFVEAHLAVMEQAKASGDLHTVHGHQYPVPESEYSRWEAEQREQRRARAIATLRRVGPILNAHKAFK